nr:histidine kinase 3 [Tanacetum cinerariifolium]
MLFGNLGELEPSLIQQEYAPVIFAQDTIEHVISVDMLTGKEDRENVMRARELGKDLYALTRYVGAKDRTNGTNDEESERRPAQLQDQLPSNELGDGAPFEESNQDINYQIVDKPTQSHKFISRDYIQLQ